MASLTSDATAEVEDYQPQALSLEVSKEHLAMYREAFDGDPLPSSMASMSYWHLRRIRDAVVKGGLLNKNLLFPRQAWYSKKAKFSGVAAKISFLKDIASVITVHVEPLLIQGIPRADGTLDELITKIKAYRGMQTNPGDGAVVTSPAANKNSHDEEESDTDRLVALNRAFTRSKDAFVASQNQLAKSFNFIEEEEQDGAQGAPNVGAYGGYNGTNHGSAEGTNGDGSGLPPPPDAMQERASSGGGGGGGLVASLGSLGLGLGSAVVGGMGKGLTEGMFMVGNLGKNVKKIAEVGISRINASVSSTISDEELRIYSDLVIDVTERSQLFDAWFRYCEGFRSYLLEMEGGDEGQQQVSGSAARQLELIESGLTSLLMVSKFMKEVLCVLLLRELEDLLKRYVKTQLALALSAEPDE